MSDYLVNEDDLLALLKHEQTSGVHFDRVTTPTEGKHQATGGKATRSGALAGVALSVMMASHSAWAQTSDASVSSNAEVLPTVVIEGNQYKTREQVGYKAEKTRVGKTQQDPKDIPQAVTVVTEQLMHEKNATTLR